jgi:hypothetical protein
VQALVRPLWALPILLLTAGLALGLTHFNYLLIHFIYLLINFVF